MACPYKASTDWYWEAVLRLYGQASTGEALSSPYSASKFAVLFTSTTPVTGSAGAVLR